ncbi:MAG TPA: hypothetical protein VFK47_05640, partial [Ktedonobacteraceae bacterium]|nr:hypothetical protein [Ktedonobacteraceae bacterium]
MTNKLLEGIQYRELKAQMPDWKHTQDQRYGDWIDIPGNGKGMVFATNAQFRTKPEYVYAVNQDAQVTIDEVLGSVKAKLSDGQTDI